MNVNKIESGVQLFSRLNRKTFLEGINPNFFPDGGPYPNQVVEITGDSQVNKNDILIDFMVKCVLPSEHHSEWKGSEAIFINTEFQINLLKIIKVMETHVNKMNVKESRKDIIEGAMKKLTIFNCYDLGELEMAFYNLEKFIYNNDNVSLVIIDNIAAHYWITKLNTNMLSYYQHSAKMFEIVFNIIKNLNVLLVFARNEKMDAKKKTLQKIDYKIDIRSKPDNSFTASVINYEKQSNICVPFTVQTIVMF